jgi:hypothetical protein
MNMSDSDSNHTRSTTSATSSPPHSTEIPRRNNHLERNNNQTSWNISSDIQAVLDPNSASFSMGDVLNNDDLMILSPPIMRPPPPVEIIDLVSDDDDEIPPHRRGTSHRTTPVHATLGSATRGPRFGAEIIDLSRDSPEINARPPPHPSRHREARQPSPDIEFVSERRLGPPPPPFPLLGMRINFHHPMIRIPPGHFVAPDIDFGAVGFDLGLDREETASPPVPPLPPAAVGLTRSPVEGGICPNCGDELSEGDSDIKRQIWLAKCGHVYCGECTMNRAKRAKQPRRTQPFKECQIDGCEKKLASKTAMIQLFL